MKVAIFSDVQANLPAMEVAVAQILDWSPDLVIMDGDLVNRGPNSLTCLQLFEQLHRDHGWLAVRGNHETWMLRCARETPRDTLDARMRQFADWTLHQIGPAVETLRHWPDHLCFHAGTESSWVHVTHGTMISNRHGVTAGLPDEALRDGALPADVALFVTAHTHRPLTRRLDGLPILNVGSAGSPFDGDPRGSYALLEFLRGRWQWRIVRFDYDRARARRDFLDSGFIEQGGPLARILYEEWSRARLLMPQWRARFETPVLDGELTLEQAVEYFLADLGSAPD
ncbi:metallophosphoesterase family protein [Marichromatium bheemlicum]|uniref:Metallophosphoesterase family protein n=1 Tax=Marichromatium bheemlicum TaxID=365339 RepID=A0ABX1I4T9_9GAMM|nr:metallophosphoesterase family protein [Marichromatium bheemlicum]NKN32574.1 metallophosphoesterase family protein [Marichromatium bheemlicum]